MSAIPTFAFPDAGDQMDVASSPYRNPEDIDIDLNSVRDASLAGSPAMIDLMDPDENERDLSVMGDLPDDMVSDDELMNEAHLPAQSDDVDIDYTMEPSAEQFPNNEDEDLYEDEDYADFDAEKKDNTANSVTEEPQAILEVDYNIAGDLLEEDATFQHEPDPGPLQDNSVNISIPPESNNANQTDAEGIVDSLDTHGNRVLSVGTDSPVAQDHLVETSDVESVSGQGVTNDDLHYIGGQEQETHSAEASGLREDDLGEKASVPVLSHSTSPTPSHTQEQSAPEQSEEQTKESNAILEQNRQIAGRHTHPVTLVYLGEEMSLFPPTLDDTSATFFLSDASLAFETLDKLLSSCRELLTGTLEHDDELVLDITSLGLHICEDSKYACHITLAQILDVYLSLCHNDAESEVRPLYCNLSSRVSLASQYAYLEGVSSEGRTFAEIAAENADTPHEEFPQDHSFAPEPTDEASAEHQAVDYGDQVHGSHEEEDGIPSGDDVSNEPSDSGAPFEATSDHARSPAPGDATQSTGAGEVPAVQEFAGEEDEIVAKEDDAENLFEQHPDAGFTTETEQVVENHEENLGAPQTDSAFSKRLSQSPVGFEEADETETASSHTLGPETHAFVDEESGAGVEVAHEADQSLASSHFAEEISSSGKHAAGIESYDPTADDVYNEDDYLIGDDNDFDGDALDDEAGENGDSGVAKAGSYTNGQGDEILEASIPTTTPITPSKGKRKVDYDDTIDLIDISTPEPKRHRPS